MTVSVSEAKRNILVFCKKHDITDFTKAIKKSALGYIAFPEYEFRTSQGAAFAVASIVREMIDSGTLRYASVGVKNGYYATWKGVNLEI